MKLHNYQVIGVQKHHEVRGFGSSPLPGSDELENSLDVDEMKEEEDVEDLVEGGRGEVFKTSWNPLRVIKQTIYIYMLCTSIYLSIYIYISSICYIPTLLYKCKRTNWHQLAVRQNIPISSKATEPKDWDFPFHFNGPRSSTSVIESQNRQLSFRK